MVTYGKNSKKKTIIGSFASFRNSQYNHTQKNRTNKRESSTHQLSAFHSTSEVEETANQSVDELGDGSENKHPSTTSPESIMPQLPRLNFSDKEMSITGKNTTNETSSPIAGHMARKPSTSNRKSSAPPIPRKSSRRKSVMYRSTRHRSLNKGSQHRRVSKELIVQVSSGIHEQTPTVVDPSDPNAINASIARTFAAMEELKPGSTTTLVVEKKRRLKAGTLLKVKNVLQGSFRRRKLGSSQEDTVTNTPFLKPPPIKKHVLGHSESHDDIGHGISEVEKLNESSRLRGLNGNFRIPRKPLNFDGGSVRSQQSTLTDPFTESPSSGDQIKTSTTFGGSNIGYPSLSDLPSGSNRKSPGQRNSKGFDDIDSLLTSSPLAQSTPRLRLECNHTDPDRSRRMQKVDAGSPSVLDHNVFAEHSDIYQGMLAGSPVKVKNQPEHLRHLIQQVGALKEKTVSTIVAAVAAVQTLSSSTSDTGFAPLERKIKKHPSPSKSYLDSWSQKLPDFPEPEPLPCHTHKHKDSNELNKASFALREKRKQLEGNQEDNEELLEGLLTSDDEFEDCIPSRPVTATHSSQTFGVEGLEVRASVQVRNIMDQDDSMMEVDELQWDQSAYDVGMRRY